MILRAVRLLPSLRAAFQGPGSSASLTLVAAFCGLGIAASGITLVRAADDAGILAFIRSESVQRAADYVRIRPPAPRMTYRLPEPREVAARPRRPVPRRNRVDFASANARIAAGMTVCVRMCDGYAFPVGTLSDSSHLPTHGTACQASCPGAETRLYTLAPGQSREDPSDARSVADGTLYRTLKTAFLFRTKRVAACSCQGPGNIASRLPVLLDPTLKAGDIVVTPDSTAKVFAGTGRAPHPARAFTDYRRSPNITVAARAQMDTVLGTSQREAAARAFERTLRTRQASLQAAGMREVAAPAGSGAGVRAFQVRNDAGTIDPSGARIVMIR